MARFRRLTTKLGGADVSPRKAVRAYPLQRLVCFDDGRSVCKVGPITQPQVIGEAARYSAGSSFAETVNKRVASHQLVSLTRTVEWAP
jgi:hypothetical protein